MAALQPQAQVAVVPDAGHNVHEEHPAAFIEIVRAFLAEAP
jgi:pimeloyl-ACP methyl ester carboxylesterase